METLHSYDALPYDSLPLPETQPDFLAAIAALHGYTAPDPRRARVLELGCASGGNLIPLAFHSPPAEFVGIELSRVQAKAGERFVAQLGINNVRIVHADLAALPSGLGTFDYIIAHGVFSWVPPEVQQALLNVCRDYLSPQGLAYISFNVTAGWEKIWPLREALLVRTDASLPAPQRVAQAREVLAQLTNEWDDSLLLREIAHLQVAAPSYLFHEFLAEYNAPMRFADFAAQLAQAGLRYVGEAGPRRALVELEDTQYLAPAAVTERWLDAETGLDDMLHTRFRRALISRDDARRAQPPQAPTLNQLAFYCDLHSDAEIDLDSDCAQDFINAGGNRFSVSPPLLKAALIALSAAYPAALTYDAVVQAAHACLDHFDATGKRDESAFREALFSLVMMHGVLVAYASTAPATDFANPPHAHALARLQAASPAWAVSGAWQVGLELDAAGRALLGLLDGSQNLPQLTHTMQRVLAQQGMELGVEKVQELVEQQLALFARQGLLQAEETT
ncbi:MAG: methyltransferase regulatory domain-containing protein [Thiobacillus sp.]